MKRLLTLVAFFATLHASAQQVNPVPDYVFRNQMSVGRNAVTDTAAYFSIGPRYGATKGFMPPIVGDTATFSSGKRNGLLIFSVQKNKFLYWDSVRVQWSDMAGGSGSYILAGDTAAMLAPYLRKADTTAMLSPYFREADTATLSNRINLKLNISDTSSMLGNYVRHAGYGLTKSGQLFLVDTLNIATRAWRQKGVDSVASLISGGTIGGSGTTNYVPKFTASSTIGNSQIFDNGTNVGIGITPGTTNLGKSLSLNYFGNGLFSYATDNVYLNANTYYNGDWKYANSAAASQYVQFGGAHLWYTAPSGTANNNVTLTERLRITSGGDVGVGTSSPTEKFHVSGGNIIVNTNQAFGWGDRTAQIVGQSGGSGFLRFDVNNAERMRIFANGRIGVNTTTDAGYQFDVNGTLRSVNGANFATTSGNVGIGTASPGKKLQVSVSPAAGSNDDGIAVNNGTNSFLFTRTGTGYSYRGVPGDAGMIYAPTNIAILADVSSNISFHTSGGEAARITPSNEMLLSTTSDAGDYKLQVSGNIYNTGSAVLAATSGSVGIGTTSPNSKLEIFDGSVFINQDRSLAWNVAGSTTLRAYIIGTSGNELQFWNRQGGVNTQAMTINAAGEILINTTTDAGDYKLQVVGNARVGTGKLDIASNTTFGLGVARSGTSEIAGQIYNSNGILYLGAESSAGGQIFSGSSAYAAVIGSGANYPLQFATNNATRATINTNGELLIGTTTDSGDFKLQVQGNVYLSGSIKTGNGFGVTAQPWILGSVVATSVQLDAANYVEVEINGTFYRLAIVTPL